MVRESPAVRLSGKPDDQLRLIIDNLPAMVWTARPDGFRDFVNKRWLEYTGLASEQAVGTDFEAVHHEDRPDFLAQWKRAVQFQTPIEREIRLRRSDGEHFWFLHRIVPFRDDSGNVLKWIATLTDVHALKSSEESLRHKHKHIKTARRQTEEQYRNVVQTAPDAVIGVDDRSSILFVNPATSRTFGYAASELVGQPLTILMPEFMRTLHTAGFERYVKTGHRHLNWLGTELIGLRKNGETFPVEVSFGEAGKNGHRIFTGFIRDITERKRAEQELQQLVDFVPQLIVVLDSVGEWIDANRVAREYTGLTLEEYRSMDVIGRVIHPDDAERMRAVRHGALLGIDPFELEARLLGKDGVYRWFLFRYNPLVEEGRARRWYASATEIESRKREEDRVRQENVRLEERTRIAQELHDTLLRTFLSALIQLTLAVDGVSPDSQTKPQFDRILQIMRQGIEEGRNAIEDLRSTGPPDLVQALSRVQQELAAQSDIDFQVNVIGRQEPLRPSVWHEIYRIGKEALVNAFSHSRANCVQFELEYTDDGLRMRVRDNGCGIDPPVLRAGREGHWGLAGMRERATRIGGSLKLSSSAAAGTEIQLSIPSDVAFQALAGR